MSEKFARFYYDKFMAEFPDVYAEDAPLATWIRLLVLAEKMWPTHPELPRSVKKAALDRLVEKRLIKVTGVTYAIRGLDAERTRRADAARNAAAKRWQSDGNAEGIAPAMPRREQDETSKRQDEGADHREDLEAFLEVRRRPPTEKQRRFLDEVLDRHDVTGPAWAAAIIRTNPDDPIGAVIAAERKWKAERLAEANQAEAEHTRRKRSVPRWFDEYRAWATSEDEPAA